MNLKRAISLLVLAVFIIGAVVWYWAMGGYSEVKVTEVKGYEVTLYGKIYEGSVKDKGFGASFEKVEKLISENKADVYASAYYYNTPTDKNGMKVKAFVGALVSDTTLNWSDDFSYQTFTLDKALRATQDAHHLVSNTYQGVQDYATEKELKLDSLYSLEEYPTKETFVLYVPYY